jgi:hypothetical protein
MSLWALFDNNECDFYGTKQDFLCFESSAKENDLGRNFLYVWESWVDL